MVVCLIDSVKGRGFKEQILPIKSGWISMQHLSKNIHVS